MINDLVPSSFSLVRNVIHAHTYVIRRPITVEQPPRVRGTVDRVRSRDTRRAKDRSGFQFDSEPLLSKGGKAFIAVLVVLHLA